MTELQTAMEDFAASANKLNEAAGRIRRLLAQMDYQKAELVRLNAIRTAGNPYPHGSDLFNAFEQARNPAFR